MIMSIWSFIKKIFNANKKTEYPEYVVGFSQNVNGKRHFVKSDSVNSIYELNNSLCGLKVLVPVTPQNVSDYMVKLDLRVGEDIGEDIGVELTCKNCLKLFKKYQQEQKKTSE